MKLMNAHQNYTKLYLTKLFHCSTATVRNIAITFIHVLHHLLYEDCMKTVPSKEYNQTSLPGSFVPFGNCKIVIDCSNIEIATPSKMFGQKITYSSYRGMDTFKDLLGIIPNAVINYVSLLYPGSHLIRQSWKDLECCHISLLGI